MSAKARPARWSGWTILLHWAGGAIILALIAMGWLMIHGDLDSAWTFDIYQWHKSWGFVALVLTAARLALRLISPSPPPVPAPLERRLAAIVQTALYVLAVAAIVSGWILVSASPLPVPTRFFDLFVIPNIAPADPSLFAAATLVHWLSAWAIALLVALHVAGALKHHLVNRDDVLRRMSPDWPRLGASRR